MPITVSVIIPCFNAARWISETIESVLAQRINNIEIIVVDDGSTDDSAAIVEGKFPGAKLIRTNNRGPSSARNTGTAAASGEFIQYLDADDLLANEKLNIQIEKLNRIGADIAYGAWQMLVRQANGEFVNGEVITRKIHNPAIDLLTGKGWNAIHAYLYRRSILEKFGGWDESLPVIQDAKFTLDCALNGGTFAFCEGIMAYYRLHGSDSVSRRDPIGFLRDSLRITNQVQHQWEIDGGITEERLSALLECYGFVARSSFRKDEELFDSALQALENLKPGYSPTHPYHLKLASQLLGYRRAELAAYWYRKAKPIFNKL